VKVSEIIPRKDTSKRDFLHTLIFISLIMLLLLPLRTVSSHQPSYAHASTEQLRCYQLGVTTHYDNLTSSYHGILELALNSTGFRTYQGNLIWNLTWDDGNTWSTSSTFYTYDWNRSYHFAGLELYTGWWIHPGVQIGDQVRIDGDAPATNNFLRTAPFIVTDLISLQIQDRFYLCWQLYYASNQPQYETFYYEFHSGILVSASSSLLVGNQPSHQVSVTLLSASPPVPTVQLLLHYWINYQSLIFAFLGATLLTLLVYYLIENLNPHHRNRYSTMKSKQNA
jgi:hypothetical protein